MKLKQFISVALVLVLTVVLSACGQNQDEQQSHNGKYAPKNATPLSKIQIFKSDEKNKKLTEKEMDAHLKAYLKANNDIIDNKYVLQHRLDDQYDGNQKVSKKLDSDLRDLANIATKNQMNFDSFIKDNEVLAKEKEDITRISKYFKAVNHKAAQADQQLEALSYSPNNTVNVVDVPTNYAGDVNHKQQKKIKAFLKTHHLDTKPIDK